MTAQPSDRLAALRAAAQAMLDDRDEAELRRQPHPELSPLLWHVGHVFFVENYWLAERVFGDTAITDVWRSLYFPEACDKTDRGPRLPAPDAMREWTDEVAAINDRYWARIDTRSHPLLDEGYLPVFVRQHYAQHIETMRLAAAQLDLARGHAGPELHAPDRNSTPRVPLPAGRHALGTGGVEAYDNEKPAHERDMDAFEIAARPVTNSQWLAFMEDGGYAQAEFWDDAGWQWRCRDGIDRPQHWRCVNGHWQIPCTAARQPLDDAPVQGIGWYEARAFARYAGARLPREHEWEAAARAGCLQAVGGVWEWCDDAFAPYTGFTAFPYDGYSRPWFDGAHFVARGASVHTEPEIRRPGFRNFYPPTHRHICAGLRLAW